MILAAANRLGLVVRAICFVAMGLVLVVAAAALVLTWRLSKGPLDVGWAARRIEEAASQPGLPTRLSIGHAFIRWGGFAEGAGQGLELRLQDVLLSDPTGAPAATVRQVDLTVSMARLLLGQVVPRAIAAEGLNLSLLRDADGRVVLDLGGLALDSDPAAKESPGPTVIESLAELARPPRLPGIRAKRPDLQHVEELQSIRLDDAVLHLHDPTLGSALRLDLLSMDLRRQSGGGVRGTAAASISLGVARATVAVRAELAPNGGTQLQLAFAPINATTVQSAEPALATTDGLDAAVQGGCTLQLDAALHPTSAVVELQAAGGRLRLAGAVIGFDSLAFGGQAVWDRPDWTLPQHLTISRSRAVVNAPGGGWPTTVTMAGHLNRAVAGYTGDVDAKLDHLAFADIAGLWPKPLGGHIRPWLTENVTAGVARDGTLKARFKASAKLSDVTMTAIDASMRGDDVTIWWLRPAPPVEQAQAVLSFKDPELLDIAVSSARQGPIPLSNGVVHFTGMADKDQFLGLGLDFAGGVPDVFTLLRNPALQLLSRSPIPIRSPAGAVSGHIAVNMPMKDVVQFEDVKIQTSSRLTDLHLAGLVVGRDLDHGAVQLDAGSDGLHAAGRAAVGGIPADLTFDMDFHNGGAGQVVQKATATARATGAQLAAAGLDSGGLMPAGSALLTARYSQRRDGAGEVQVAADLHDAALAIAGWSKAPGPAADLGARLLLRGDQMTGIDQLHATGPGMAIDGHVGMVGDQPLLLVLDRLALGGTQASGQVRLPAAPPEPIRVTLGGPMLDLSSPPDNQAPSTRGAGKPEPSKPGPAWIADLRFERVRLSAKDSVGLINLVAHAENDGSRISALTLSTGGPEQVRAAIQPEGKGRHLTVQAADGGSLLRAAGVGGGVQGGRLTLDAKFDDTRPTMPLSGTAELSNFHVSNAPVLGKLLQAATIYGVVDALRGPGLVFSDLVLPFRLEDGVLQLIDARAFSSSLGLTAKGLIDTGHNTIDMQGTVVPAYVLNSLLGRIPLVGRLFSAEQGGGLLAVNYGLHGSLSDPAVTLNPLSALTPGFLRGLFHVFE